MQKHTAFITAALKILATPKGDLTCHDERGELTTLRKAWTVPQLQLWERTEGVGVSRIDTLEHWLSYTGL